MQNNFSETKIILIGSGKGGVGKSTVAVNLAVAFAQKGLKTGLLDADVYGPSVPAMLGLRKMSPRVEHFNDQNELIIPLTKFGIQAISLGFFLEESRSIIWRGPMIHGILSKFIQNVYWGELDVLVVDLPPGTGDILLSLSQLLPITGALVVSTPQEIATLDAIKAINAFYQLEVPLFGLVENMAGFAPPGSNEIYRIFGEGKVQELALRFDTEVLVSIPLIIDIRIGGDSGIPFAFERRHESANDFAVLVEKVLQQTEPIANPFQ